MDLELDPKLTSPPEPEWTLNSGQKVQCKYGSRSGVDPHHNKLRRDIYGTTAGARVDPKFRSKINPKYGSGA